MINNKQPQYNSARQKPNINHRSNKIDAVRKYIGLTNSKGAAAMVRTLLTKANGSITRLKLDINRCTKRSTSERKYNVNSKEIIMRYYTQELPGSSHEDTTSDNTNNIPGSIMYLKVNYKQPMLRGRQRGDTTESGYYNKLVQDITNKTEQN